MVVRTVLDVLDVVTLVAEVCDVVDFELLVVEGTLEVDDVAGLVVLVTGPDVVGNDSSIKNATASFVNSCAWLKSKPLTVLRSPVP